MNPSYPVNGSPYAQQPYPQHTSPSPSSAPGHPPPPQYAYPIHASPYPPHYYPQYAQPMMMYAPPPRTSGTPDTPQPGPSSAQESAANAGTKRKRKSGPGYGRGKGTDKGSDDEAGASGSDLQTSSQQKSNAASLDMKKRTKTVGSVSLHFIVSSLKSASPATCLRLLPEPQNPLRYCP